MPLRQHHWLHSGRYLIDGPATGTEGASIAAGTVRVAGVPFPCSSTSRKSVHSVMRFHSSCNRCCNSRCLCSFVCKWQSESRRSCRSSCMSPRSFITRFSSLVTCFSNFWRHVQSLFISHRNSASSSIWSWIRSVSDSSSFSKCSIRLCTYTVSPSWPHNDKERLLRFFLVFHKEFKFITK